MNNWDSSLIRHTEKNCSMHHQQIAAKPRHEKTNAKSSPRKSKAYHDTCRASNGSNVNSSTFIQTIVLTHKSTHHYISVFCFRERDAPLPLRIYTCVQISLAVSNILSKQQTSKNVLSLLVLYMRKLR